MQDDRGQRRRPLPPESLAGLRSAFAGEVGERLPRLLRLLHVPPGPHALRDAHALGSSSVVVGEIAVSRCARALEAELARDAPDPARTTELVRELAGRLEGWVGR
ncbi:MAG: hypothetical protein WD794_17115 [Mycobacteriales bacterium]